MAPDAQLVTRLGATVGEELSRQQTARKQQGLPPLGVDHERALCRKLLAEKLEVLASQALRAGHKPLDWQEEAELAQAVIDRLYGLGAMQRYVDDPDLTDVDINGYDVVWLTHKDGTKSRGEPVAASDDELVSLVATAARRLGRTERQWNYAHPVLQLQLPGGHRLHAVMAVGQRPYISIRSHNWDINRLAHLLEREMFDHVLYEFLRDLVLARRNIIVGGGTQAGKTTVLRCLINEIPPNERLVIIEDTAELCIDRFPQLHPDLVQLEARPPNLEGVGEVSMAELVRCGLRMHPDRVFVGEVRGLEAEPMLLAMSQGNPGSMCSIHAESSANVFKRLWTYARLNPDVTNQLVADAVHFVVYLDWVDGVRRVVSVREIRGAQGLQVATNEVFEPGPDGRAVVGSPPSEETLRRLEAVGFDRDILHWPKLGGVR